MQTTYYIGLDVHKRDDQLLREGWPWRDSRRRYDSCHTFGLGPLDENPAADVDRGDGSHGFYRVDLRSLAATSLTIPAVGPITALSWVLEVGDAK